MACQIRGNTALQDSRPAPTSASIHGVAGPIQRKATCHLANRQQWARTKKVREFFLHPEGESGAAGRGAGNPSGCLALLRNCTGGLELRSNSPGTRSVPAPSDPAGHLPLRVRKPQQPWIEA